MGEKKVYTTRLDSEKVNDLFAFYGITGESLNEQFSRFIDTLNDKLILYKKSETVSKQPTDSETPTEELTCKLRISVENAFYCVTKPPKVTKLLTLDVCKVCLALTRGLTNETRRLGQQIEKSQHHENVNPPQQAQQTAYINPMLEGLASYKFKHHCTIDNRPAWLLDLPCVRNRDPDRDPNITCRHQQCAENIQRAYSLYVSRSRPSQNVNQK